MPMQINGLLDNGVFKYSVGTTLPTYSSSTFVHHFNINDQITWVTGRVTSGCKLPSTRISVPLRTRMTILGRARPQHSRAKPPSSTHVFDMNQKYRRIKYSVTLLDAPGSPKPKDDPEVIIVNG